MLVRLCCEPPEAVGMGQAGPWALLCGSEGQSPRVVPLLAACVVPWLPGHFLCGRRPLRTVVALTVGTGYFRDNAGTFLGYLTGG